VIIRRGIEAAWTITAAGSTAWRLQRKGVSGFRFRVSAKPVAHSLGKEADAAHGTAIGISSILPRTGFAET